MAKSLIESLQEVSDAFTDFYIRLAYGHEGIAKIWEQKMHPGVFELRMDMRRDLRKERKNMALLRVVGGLLTLFFYLFLLVGIVVTAGLLFAYPLVGLFFAVCAVAAIIEVVRRNRSDDQ